MVFGWGFRSRGLGFDGFGFLIGVPRICNLGFGIVGFGVWDAWIFSFHGGDWQFFTA